MTAATAELGLEVSEDEGEEEKWEHLLTCTQTKNNQASNQAVQTLRPL